MAGNGMSVTIADARFAKPLDTDLIDDLAVTHESLLIVEEGSPGGFSAHVMTYLANQGHLDGLLKVRALTLPDKFIDHDSQPGQLASAGLILMEFIRLHEIYCRNRVKSWFVKRLKVRDSYLSSFCINFFGGV